MIVSIPLNDILLQKDGDLSVPSRISLGRETSYSWQLIRYFKRKERYLLAQYQESLWKERIQAEGEKK